MEKTESEFVDPVERVRALGHHTKDLAGEFEETAGAAVRFVQREVSAHPYRSLLATAAVGYVLGGGLVTPLTRRFVWVGTRFWIFPLLRSQFLGKQGATVQSTELSY